MLSKSIPISVLSKDCPSSFTERKIKNNCSDLSEQFTIQLSPKIILTTGDKNKNTKYFEKKSHKTFNNDYELHSMNMINDSLEEAQLEENLVIHESEDDSNKILLDIGSTINGKMLNEFFLENKNNNLDSQNENQKYLYDNSINDEKSRNYLKNNNHHRNFFSKIIDCEILIDTKEVYSKPWTELINNIYSQCQSENNSIQQISLGSQHTLCISNKGKLYSFGWNNYHQCGVKNNELENINIENLNEIKIGHRVIGISTGEDHSLIITEEGYLYGFGLNSNGQLCYSFDKHKIINKPTLIKSFKNLFINDIQCTGNISFMLSSIGNAFICPWEDENKNIHYNPLKLYFPNKEFITSISCGENFVMFISKNGNLFSMGSNNKFGQLGHGDAHPRYSPTIIEYFATNNIKIIQVSCGYSHVLSLSEDGKAYSWGLGNCGQLGLGENMEYNYSPKSINAFKEKSEIIFQVSAGFHSSYFLTEKNGVYFCGTNSDDRYKDTFVPIEINIKIMYKDLINNPCWICRILNCWNRSMSIFYAVFLDCYFINKDDEKVHKVLNLISKKWLQQSFSNSIMEGIENINYN